VQPGEEVSDTTRQAVRDALEAHIRAVMVEEGQIEADGIVVMSEWIAYGSMQYLDHPSSTFYQVVAERDDPHKALGLAHALVLDVEDNWRDDD
jgi:hypothetical protein